MNRLFSSAPKMKKTYGSAQYMYVFYFHCNLSIDVKTHETQLGLFWSVEVSGPQPVDHDPFGVKMALSQELLEITRKHKYLYYD